MADRNAFYQAIWASPDDDLPRLVFADWLDEHDDPDAAAFLRLLSACRTCPPDVDRLRPLVAELRRAMVKLPPEFIESACPVHPALVIGPWVDVDHEANRKVLEFIHSRRRSRVGVQVPAEALPVRPGLHAVWEEWPVKRLWDELSAALTPGSACAVDGTPALVDVWSGVVLAVATDGIGYVVRMPAGVDADDPRRRSSLPPDRHGNRVRVASVLGSDWVAGQDSAVEESWLKQAAAEFDPANQPE